MCVTRPLNILWLHLPPVRYFVQIWIFRYPCALSSISLLSRRFTSLLACNPILNCMLVSLWQAAEGMAWKLYQYSQVCELISRITRSSICSKTILYKIAIIVSQHLHNTTRWKHMSVGLPICILKIKCYKAIQEVYWSLVNVITKPIWIFLLFLYSSIFISR